MAAGFKSVHGLLFQLAPKGATMSAVTAADIIIETLIDWKVEVVFGLPGDGINGLIEALRKLQDRIRFVQTRHEESAALAACGYAKWTGKLGVCIATSGPGGIHLLNGLYDAKLDGQPVLAITGLQYHDLIGTYTQQDVDLDKLFIDVSVYNARIMGAAHAENVVSLACRSAIVRQGVAHITIPVDLQDEPVRKDSRTPRNRPHHVSDVLACPPNLPSHAQLTAAAEILNGAKKPAILAGRGALGAGRALAEIAARLAAPVANALLGKGVLPDDSPYATGGVGLLGTRASQEMMEECDALLIAGSSFPYIEFYPKPGQARGVQIDRDPARIGLRYPVECGLIGDAGLILEALLPHLKQNENGDFLERARKSVAEWNELMAIPATRTEKPMKPQVVAYELDKLLREDAIIAVDTGTITAWAARYLRMKGDMKFGHSGSLATMACGLPYAIAAAIAYPKRQVIAFVGDGGLSMLLGELATCVKYKLPIKIVVIKNNSLGMIKWEQMVFLGNPEYVCDLQPIDFATVARGFGIPGFTVDDPAACASVLADAMQIEGPALVEAVVDPHEPPMPPKVTAKQAAHFAQALVRGTPHAGRIALTVASDKVRELV
jgi:pyruvate dehydrogenase (quinone)